MRYATLFLYVNHSRKRRQLLPTTLRACGRWLPEKPFANTMDIIKVRVLDSLGMFLPEFVTD